jgi:hypothetical protein
VSLLPAAATDEKEAAMSRSSTPTAAPTAAATARAGEKRRRTEALRAELSRTRRSSAAGAGGVREPI